jgi:hypothetical protein
MPLSPSSPPQKKCMKPTKRNRLVATHEAAHAFLHNHFSPGCVVEVVIRSDGTGFCHIENAVINRTEQALGLIGATVAMDILRGKRFSSRRLIMDGLCSRSGESDYKKLTDLFVDIHGLPRGSDVHTFGFVCDAWIVYVAELVKVEYLPLSATPAQVQPQTQTRASNHL